MSIGRTNAGSGGTGGTLTVTAPAGVAVTVSKDNKSKSKISGVSGVVVFKGLNSGTWMVSISDGSQTASKPVVITADYSIIMAFFAATINITYPVGSTCTATDGTTTLTAPDTSGTWACVVPNTGTWTLSCTDGTESTSESVTITTDGQSERVSLAYWNGELYNAGNEYGGWSYVPMKLNTSYVNTKEPNVEKSATSMKITQPTYTNCCAYVYNDEVDLTDFDTLEFDGTLSTAMTSFPLAASLCIWTKLGEYAETNKVAYINFSTTAPKKIDVKDLAGKHRIGFFLFSNGSYAEVNSLLLV